MENAKVVSVFHYPTFKPTSILSLSVHSWCCVCTDRYTRSELYLPIAVPRSHDCRSRRWGYHVGCCVLAPDGTRSTEISGLWYLWCEHYLRAPGWRVTADRGQYLRVTIYSTRILAVILIYQPKFKQNSALWESNWRFSDLQRAELWAMEKIL